MVLTLPPYRLVADDLRRQIDAGHWLPGQALPTEPRLAERYGVARMTLRKAVECLIEEGLLVRQQGRGTFVNGGLQTTRLSYLLYVGQMEGHFYQNLYCALTQEARTQQLSIIGMPALATPAEIEHFREIAGQAQAVICQLTHEDIRPIVTPHLPDTTPFISFSAASLPCAQPGVRQPAYHLMLDIRAAMRMATEHLLQCGHRRLALVVAGPLPGPAPEIGRPYPDYTEYLGYRDAVSQVPGVQEMVIGIPTETEDWEHQHDVTLAAAFEGGELPTAIICDADFRAARVLATLQRMGVRCPEEVSVIGQWNTPWASITTPALTTISFAEEEVARLLLLLAQHPVAATPTQLTVTPQLVERGSVRCLTQ